MPLSLTTVQILGLETQQHRLPIVGPRRRCAAAIPRGPGAGSFAPSASSLSARGHPSTAASSETVGSGSAPGDGGCESRLLRGLDLDSLLQLLLDRGQRRRLARHRIGQRTAARRNKRGRRCLRPTEQTPWGCFHHGPSMGPAEERWTSSGSASWWSTPTRLAWPRPHSLTPDLVARCLPAPPGGTGRGQRRPSTVRRPAAL